MISRIEIYCCYAHKDQPFLGELKTHLVLLQREGPIDIWHDTKISPGKEWKRESDKHLNAAQIILLLVSPDFMSSEDCQNEMLRAMERHERGEAHVIPIILRPVNWKNSPFAKLRVLPFNEKPISTRSNRSGRDEAFVNIIEGIRTVIGELQVQKVPPIEGNMIACPNPRCKINNNPLGSKFCGTCGAELSNTTKLNDPTQASTQPLPEEPITTRPPSTIHPSWRVIVVILVLIIIIGSVVFSVFHGIKADTSTQEKVAVPSYFDPNSPGWTQMENGASTPGLAIINPNSGPGTSRYQAYADTVTQAKKAGIIVVGYIFTSYAGTHDRTRTLAAAEQDIDNYYSWYPNIEGIFVDAVSTDCGRSYSSYYKPLYDYIKQKGRVPEVILNPGTNTSECYMSVGDIIVNFEGLYSSYVNWFPTHWVSKYPANRFWHIITGTSQVNMSQAVALSKSWNAGWVYVTDQAGANPFAALPSYWSNELLLLSHS